MHTLTMDKIIEQLLTQGSPLVVLVIVVYFFLQHLQKTSANINQQLNTMNQQHLEAREQMKDALLQNAESTRENTKALQSLERAVAQKL